MEKTMRCLCLVHAAPEGGGSDAVIDLWELPLVRDNLAD